MTKPDAARIILVDDDPLVREGAAKLLNGGGFVVQPCGEAHEAIERLRAGPVDAVLSDIKMPGLTGIELLGEIRALDPEVPVLLMTGFADLEVTVAAIHGGAFDFILKPYNPPQLLHSVGKAVEFKRLRQIEKNYQAELEFRVEETTRELQATHEIMLQGEKMASIGQLAAGVAHEINNPVGFISSNLGSLNKYLGRLTDFMDSQAKAIETSCPPEVKDAIQAERRKIKLDLITEDLGPLIDESLEGAERVKKLVQNLKSFSRADETEPKPTDINEVIENSINVCWNELKYVAELKKEYGELPSIKAYPQQLGQVFMNLLVNAAHAIETKGEISIRSWHEGGTIFVFISDTGCGIPEENLGRIFEPFFTTKESGKGTGLGLSIIYDIVKKHQGDIRVESVPGEGTTFIVKLPVVE